MLTPSRVFIAVLVCFCATGHAAAQTKERVKEFEQTLRGGLDGFLINRGMRKADVKLAKMLAEQVSNAAHPTNRGVLLKAYRVDAARGGQQVVVMDVVYFGLQTPAGYTADVRITVEPGQAGWTVKEIDFHDQRNPVGPDAECLAKFKERLNTVLED
jgi:hypothetical protein